MVEHLIDDAINEDSQESSADFQPRSVQMRETRLVILTPLGFVNLFFIHLLISIFLCFSPRVIFIILCKFYFS